MVKGVECFHLLSPTSVPIFSCCLRLKTPEERERLLRLELKNSRVIDEFAEFVEEGAEYTARSDHRSREAG